MSTLKLLEKKENAVLIFIICSLIVIVSSYFYFQKIKNDYINDVKKELKAISEIKISQIAEAYKDELVDSKLISHSQYLHNEMQKVLLNPLSKRNSFNDYLNEIYLEHGYENVFICDLNLKIIASAVQDNIELSTHLKNLLNDSKNLQSTFCSDFYYCDKHSELHLEFISKIFIEGKKVGYFIGRKNPNDILNLFYQIVGIDRNSLEIVLVKKEGEFAIPVTHLAHRKNLALNIKIPSNKKLLAGVEALKGKKEFFWGKDYRNVDILSYLSPVEGTNWFFVAKIDKSEINHSIFSNIALYAIFPFMFLLGIFFFIFWYYHYSQSNLYQKLYDDERKVREANEEFEAILYSIGDAVIITDKEGRIKNMNPVGENLTGWSEEDSKNLPIQTVFNIINEQTRMTVENPVDRVLKENTVARLANHTLLISKDGREIPIADSGAPIVNDDGTVNGVVLVFRDQTREREAKKRIEKSEERLERGEVVAKSGNWELDLNTKIMHASKGAALIYGVEREQFNYEFVKNIPLAEYRQMLDEALIDLIKNGKPYNVQFKIKTPTTGEIKDIHSIAVYDKNKNILFGVIQDITEFKKLQQKLIESEANLNSLINFKDQSMWSLDENFRLIISNDYFLNAYKAAYNFDLKVGMNLIEILPPHLREIWEAKYREALSGNKVSFEFSEIIFGKRFYFDVILNPIYYSLEVKGISVLSIDITNLVETRKALEESEENYRTIFNSSSEAIFVHDAITGKMISVNDAVVKMYGYSSKEEILNGNIGDLSANVGEYNEAHAQELIRKAIDEGSQTFEWFAKRKDGSTFWIEMNLKKTNVAGKEIILAVGRDIDEKKKANEKIVEQLTELRRWQNVILDREDRIIELKNEVNLLLGKIGGDKKYNV